MKKKIILFPILGIIITAMWSLNSCKKIKYAEGTDKELYDMAKDMSDFEWYKNSDNLLNRSSGSGHSQAFLRTRYNIKAKTKLDSQRKVFDGITFPEGSLIVKELYGDATTLSRYAILYKNSKSANADAKGWVWGYIDADGKVAVEASKKGVSCLNCHSQSGSIDYTLMNKFFP